MDISPLEKTSSPDEYETNFEIQEPSPEVPRIPFPVRLRKFWIGFVLFAYLLGIGSGFILRGTLPSKEEGTQTAAGENEKMTVHIDQINPPDGVELPVKFGDFAPQLLAAGAIDYGQFVKLYQEIGSPLDKNQVAILTEGRNEKVVIRKDNAHFLLNLFWALGLTNQNKILSEGPMTQNGKDKVVGFASTGGWTLASKPVADLYASEPILSLSEEQQKRLEEVAQAVYRPCCDNPTHFPDCNHGMAMLGLLELMASQGATVEQMFEAARWVNAFWFPQQSFELAVAIKAIENIDFEKADPRSIVGRQFSSGSGFQAVHGWLAQNGQLEEGSGGGGSCGVK